MTLLFALFNVLLTAPGAIASSRLPRGGGMVARKPVDSTVNFNELCLPTAETLQPIEGGWTKESLLQSKYWGMQFSKAELKELGDALEHCKQNGLELQDGWQPIGVTRENFPLPTLAAKLEGIVHELEHGTGAAMIENMPVDDYSVEELGVIYAGINAHIGNWVPQSSAGLRSKSRGFGLPLGRVEAEMNGNTPLGGKQANNYFRLHTDRCDVITLMCVKPAAAGGASRVASSIRIHNTLLKERPALCARLYQPYHRIWEGSKGHFPLPVWAVNEGKFTSQVSPSYIENAQIVDGVPKLDSNGIEAVDLLEEVGLRHSHEFMMQKGMVYWLNNHVVYHGRDSWRFNGDPSSEAADATIAGDNGKKGTGDGGRLMLRMWLSPRNTRKLPDTPCFRHCWGDVSSGAPRGGLGPALASGLTEKAKELKDAVEDGSYKYYGLFKRAYGEDATAL